VVGLVLLAVAVYAAFTVALEEAGPDVAYAGRWPSTKDR
jgi:hypothetical protein